MAKESEVLGGVQATLTNANPAALLQHAALPDLNKEEIARYSRHLIMPEVGMAGQRKLKAASVLLTGAGRPGLAAWIIPDGGGCGTDWSGGFRRGRLQQPAASSHSRDEGCGTTQTAIGQRPLDGC